MMACGFSKSYTSTKEHSSVQSANDGKICETETIFPPDFKPRTNDVIIGRGKKCSQHTGNERLRSFVTSKVAEYKAAQTKSDKSKIISDIVTGVIRNGQPQGAFIKEDPSTGYWFDVGDFVAREKVSQAFRDILSAEYRSSNEYKKKRRREQYVKKLPRKRVSSKKRSRVLEEETDCTVIPYPVRSVEENEYLLDIDDIKADLLNHGLHVVEEDDGLDLIYRKPSMMIEENTTKKENNDMITYDALPDSSSLVQWFEDSNGLFSELYSSNCEIGSTASPSFGVNASDELVLLLSSEELEESCGKQLDVICDNYKFMAQEFGNESYESCSHELRSSPNRKFNSLVQRCRKSVVAKMA